jgi:hypothetical protein
MVYDTTQTGMDGGFNFQSGQMQMNQNFSVNSMDTQEVQSFYGQTYAINHSVVLFVAGSDEFTSTYLEQINKTGYSQIISSTVTPTVSPTLSPNQTCFNESAFNPVLAFLAVPEVKVGDTKVIQIPTENTKNIMNGNVTLTFVDIQNVTVPAGTFKVFRVDSASKDTTQTFANGIFENGESMTVTDVFNEQSYVQYDTGKLILSTENVSTITDFGSLSNESSSPSPVLADNYTSSTQLVSDIMPGQALPSPAPVLPQQQESSLFLQNVGQLDTGHYSVQSQGTLVAGFYKISLTSNGSSLDALFNFNNNRVVWCQLYPSQGSPDFTATSASNLQAAITFLNNYQTYTQALYIQPMLNMLSNVSGNVSTTVTQVQLTLNISADGNQTTTFTWTNTQNAGEALTLTIQNGNFMNFSDSWT